MTLSTSPLCPHIEQGSGADWLRALPVRPKAVKVFSSGACRDVKSVDPRIVTVKRRWVPNQDAYLYQGAEGGRRFVREQGDLEGVDILEGLNECVPVGDPDAIRRANDFHLGFVEECVRRGVKPCILNIAVGNPEVVRDGQPWDGEVRLLVSCVQAALDAGGYVGYHGYGPRDLLTDSDWLAFRDVLRLGPLLNQSGVVGVIHWLHTEAGYDHIGGDDNSGAWKYLMRRGLATKRQIQEGYERYAYRCWELGIEMAFIYTFWGTAMWADYEHTDDTEMMRWYAQHLEQYAAMPPPANRRRVIAREGLRIRHRPAMNAAILHTKPYGTEFVVLAEEEHNGYRWYRLELETGGSGGVPSGADPASGYAWCRADPEFSTPI